MADTVASGLALHERSISLLAHLQELRKRIILSVLGILAGFLLCWSFADRLFGLMQQPIIYALRRHGIGGGLVYLNPTEPFNLYLQVAFVAGLFAASPFVFYQLWLFIAPGLHRSERRYVLPFLFCTVGLFVAGGLFGYKMVYPASLDFLIAYGERFQPMITVGEYTKLFATIIIGFGLMFEMPILVFFLAFMRVVTAGWMAESAIFDPCHFCSRRSHHTYRRYPEHVSFRRPDGGALRHQYRRGVAGTFPTQSASRGRLAGVAIPPSVRLP